MLHSRREIRIFLCWNNTCQDNSYLQLHLELILDSIQKRDPLGQTIKKVSCLIFKVNITHLAHGRALQRLIIVSDERLIIVSDDRLKSLFVQAKFTRTLCIRTMHVPNVYTVLKVENSSFIVIPTIRGERATNRKCSHLIHTCLQRIIRSGRDGEFRDG